MEHMSRVSCGWGWLERTLNQMIDLIHARGVIPSSTVAVQESPNGCLLSVQIPTMSPQGGGGDAPTFIKVIVMDEKCNKKTLMVYGYVVQDDTSGA